MCRLSPCAVIFPIQFVVTVQFYAVSLIVDPIAGYDSTTEVETDHEKSVDADSRDTKHVKHKVCVSH